MICIRIALVIGFVPDGGDVGNTIVGKDGCGS